MMMMIGTDAGSCCVGMKCPHTTSLGTFKPWLDKHYAAFLESGAVIQDSRLSYLLIDNSSAAISLRCGGICNDHFVAYFVLSLAVKENCLIFRKVIGTSRVSWFFCLTV